MIPSYFWPGTVLVYLGLLLCLVEVLFEPWMKRRRWARGVGVLIVVLLIAVFSLRVAWTSAPLDALAFMPDGEYTSGSIVHGIKWVHGLTEVRLLLENPTDSDYQNVDVFIQPNSPLSKIVQVSTLPEVFFIGDPKPGEIEIGNFVIGGIELQKKLPDGTVTKRTPLIPASTTEGCRVRCPVLPKKTTLELALAVGEAGVDQHRPSNIRVVGTYVGMFRPRVLEKTISLVGNRK